MDDAAEQALRRELRPDERLLWSGMPRQGLFLRPADAIAIPFSLIWGGFALSWQASAIAAGADVGTVLFGIPFALMGLYLIAGRFFADRYRRSRTHYGVTNDRVLISGGLWQREINSVSLSGLSEISVRERSNGRGGITFGPLSSLSGMPLNPSEGVFPGLGKDLVPTFDTIDDVRNVYGIIQEARRAKG